MGAQSQLYTVDASVPADIPESREYTRQADADLDRALVDAIEAAQQADNSFLARLLALELGSHYYDSQ